MSKPYYDKEDRSEALIGPSLIRQETPADHIKLRAAHKSKYDELLLARYSTAEDIRACQLRTIQAMVKYACDHVPLYRRKYAAEGFDPRDLKTWDDFYRLPFLTKDELIAGWPDETMSDEHNTEFMTMSSGSSGRFVYLAVDEAAVHFENLQMARQNVFQSGGTIGDRELTLFIITCPWWFTSTDGLFPQHFLSTRTPVEEAYEVIKRMRPAVLSLYPTYLRKLAALNPDLAGCGVRLIITHSEGSSTLERKTLSQSLGVNIRDEYSSEELIRMALECPHGQYHVEEDVCHMEIIDPATGTKLGVGELGEVVGTNLVNHATPFIRYRQGDLASLMPPAACPCGTTFVRMTSPMGRKDDSFITACGDIVPAGALIDDAYNWVLESRIPLNGLQYQLVQRSREDVDVFIVPGTGFDAAFATEACDKISRRMAELLGAGVRIETKIVKHVPYASGRKTKAALSLINTPEVAR